MDAPIFNRWSFTVTWVVRIVLVLPIVQLGKHILELLRNGQVDMSGVFKQGLIRSRRSLCFHGQMRTSMPNASADIFAE